MVLTEDIPSYQIWGTTIFSTNPSTKCIIFKGSSQSGAPAHVGPLGYSFG